MKTLSKVPEELFKKGDKITLNTGFSCDAGTFLRYDGNDIVWQHRHGNIYKSPIDQYKITLQKK